LGLSAIGSTIDGPIRHAMLPAAAADTQWPLTRINGMFEMGANIAVVAGMILILEFDSLHEVMLYSPWLVFNAILLLNGFASLATLPVAFPSDTRRSEPPLRALRGFFTDGWAIWKDREARICLLGLAGLRGVIIGIIGVLLACVIDDKDFFMKIVSSAGWLAGGMALGSLLAGTQRHPRRVLGFVAWGGIGLTISLIWAAASDTPGDWVCALFGVMAGLINVPLLTTYQIALPPDARGNGMVVRNMTDSLFTAVAAVMLFVFTQHGGVSPPVVLWLIAAIAAGATGAAWWIFRRAIAEQLLEVAFFIMYRFRGAGPGLDKFPLRGPAIAIANHSAYCDPLWLGKYAPRALVPMMTSIFFDHPLLRWIMVYLADAIRVEYSGFRREVPELKIAVAALDAGKCLVLFPEGRLRRRDDEPLKMFGQGIWHILRERPGTPVIPCWIEGGWGSFFSYCGGPPMKNKPFDIRRPLGIAVGEPLVLSEEILADPRKTRLYLMERCLEVRKYLGLEPVALQQAEAVGAED
jgi:1-acyl-sn-glycerol-3-phosphate acyltransferase